MALAAEFIDVSKRFPLDWLGRRSVDAVAGVSLQIQSGEVFGLLGPNRAGKTTLIKLLLSLCRPTAGTVRRFGQDRAHRSTLGRVGYMHESHVFPGHLTASQLLRYYGAMSGVVPPELDMRLPELLKFVGLADRACEPICNFSKGMNQRLGLAQALVNQPDLLILDEPTEGLDLLGRQIVRSTIAEYRRQGRTTILVSHVLSEVEQLCDRIGVLVAGRLAYLGSVDGLPGSNNGPGDRSMESALSNLYSQAAA